ncbi:FecR family protein [Ottowia sp.]|uniref:FecR family protein n=1 Tax=Ottowia sp. TaxID=1898956 RepID=UPI0039E43E4B
MNQDARPTHDAASAQDEADAREFDEYARTQDPVLLQAALWATRRSEGLDADAEAEFQEWLRADPRHAEACEEMEESLDPVRELPDDKVQALKAGLRQPTPAEAKAPQAVRPPIHPVRPASPGRRAWLSGIGSFFPQAATALAVAALVGGGWMGWGHYRSQPVFAKDYATQRGQRLNVDLPDGSRLEFDAATQAQVRLYRDRREVRLLEGQAMFSVQADPGQPFDVLAGAARVTVVGTRFSVRHTASGLDAGQTVVAVESGRVRVARMASSGDAAGDGDAPVELTAGQSVAADAAGRLQPVASVAPDSVAGWRKGRVNFNDTPLAQALAELERYGDTGLIVRDPAVGALRLGGSFDLREMRTFTQALPSLLPVRLERRGGQVEIVARR